MIRAYCNQTVKLKRGSGINKYGSPKVKVEEDLRCRVDWINQLVRNYEGEEVVSAAKIMILFDGAIYYDDLIEISGRDHPILKIERVQDFSASHQIVWIK